MGKNRYDPENVPSVQVSINIPHGFSFSEERKFFNLDHHQRHNKQTHIIHIYILKINKNTNKTQDLKLQKK